jgi:hypothetical protein
VHRLVAALAVVTFFASGTVALADGVSYISQGGLGVLAPDGKARYVALPTRGSTAIERVGVRGGQVTGWATLQGFWGIPAPTAGVTGAEGLTRDGRKLFVTTPGFAPTRFAVINTRTLRVIDRFTLKGGFSYDALSPDGTTLYLIQHVDSSNFNRYVVRAYDPRSHTLAAGRIADKSQLDWVMEGAALTRATSADDRWVYTLYQRPGGYPFVHALDTVNGVAHCIGLPWSGDQTPLWNIRLAVQDGGTTLALHWKSGKPWLTMNTTNWRLTHVHPGGGFPWRWMLAGAGSFVALLLGAGAFLRLRRQPRGAVPVPL